ncbi:hypothetical protein OGAPHI_003419 [Ogataea philodendri]|uniref:Uncharacterized protein n=1 Tax=Ogataea philodendri TaxID=1378263 RepID=A0A9P8P8N1_9ASCO|nr:uncharacterized protein OGAPHI_003419 [Ogataea philodendri]KAH3666969.1 hypothetical protein OGAPHI_003419 [Ogataea philodendri]
MQFSVATLLFAATSFAAASSVVLTKTEASTVSSTIYSCDETVTDCPYKNSTISTYEAGAASGFGSYYAAAGAAVAAGALLL